MMKLITITAAALLATTSAYAADAVIYSDAAPVAMAPAPVSNWSGFYIYGLAGYENASSDNKHLAAGSFGGPGGTFEHDGDGFIYGAAAGYNWQFNNGVVVGAELGIRSGTDIDDGDAYAIYKNYTDSSLEYLGTLKARLGYDAGQWMPYITGGVAHGKLETNQWLPWETWSASKSATGFVVGAGADFKVTEQVFLGLEYNYTDLGKVEFSGPDRSPQGTTAIEGRYKSHAVFAKIGYKF